MSAATLELTPLFEQGEQGAMTEDRRGREGPGGATLEDVILEAWEGLAARGRAACPVCGDELEPAGCGGCGSVLS